MRREWIKSLSSIAFQFGATDYSIEHGGKHPHMVICFGSGRIIRYAFPSTPSDHRSLRNSCAQLRRLLMAGPRAPAPACLPRSIRGLAA